MKDMFFLVTTYLRDGLLLRSLESIRQHYPHAAIYVADSGPHSPKKGDMSKRLGVTFCYMEPGCGYGVARNRILALAPKYFKYFFLVEDDIIITKKTAIAPLVSVMESDPEIGFVSCRRKGSRESRWAADFSIDHDKTLIIKFRARFEWQRAGAVKFIYCDYAPNTGLFDRVKWEAFGWDEDFIWTGEHLHNALRAKFKGGIKSAYTEACSVLHEHGAAAENSDYEAALKRAGGHKKLFDYWGLTGLEMPGWREHGGTI